MKQESGEHASPIPRVGPKVICPRVVNLSHLERKHAHGLSATYTTAAVLVVHIMMDGTHSKKGLTATQERAC